MMKAIVTSALLAAALIVQLPPYGARAAAVQQGAGQVEAGEKASGGGEDIPLSRQLEGLGPLPRLAYLRHLMSQGRNDAEVMFQAAVAFHELDQADSALHYYDMTIALDPDNFKAHVNKGVIYDDRGDYARAIQSFATAATLNPDDVLAHSHLAFLLYQNKDYRAAWQHLETALRIDPDHPQPHFYLAIFFWEARIFMEAMREWEKVMELEPDGFLAAKARENIVMLQKALDSPSDGAEWTPGR